jgi:NAD(P)-dependent dehydrogenase (short-subunit alcohol dehydrogenase family)
VIDEIFKLLTRVKAMHPMGRFGRPEEVASTILWLFSENASFVTGHIHAVDGGFLI